MFMSQRSFRMGGDSKCISLDSVHCTHIFVAEWYIVMDCSLLSVFFHPYIQTNCWLVKSGMPNNIDKRNRVVYLTYCRAVAKEHVFSPLTLIWLKESIYICRSTCIATAIL